MIISLILPALLIMIGEVSDAGVQGAPMKITWFGQSAFRIETGKSVLMVDPFLSGNPIFRGDPQQATVGTTHVALTHGHDDHVGDTVSICKSNSATLIAVFEIVSHLSKKGVENLEPTNTGGSIYTDDFDITFVQAFHSSSSEGVYLGNPSGLIIKSKREKHTIYHMGDTAIFGDMSLINRLHRPDIGIVPVGDRFTMNPETAAFACRSFFKFKTIIPCHYATFPGYLLPDASRFIKAMGPGKRAIKELRVGESISL
ncbi:MAG TPA: metal-dependent hydrolase [Aestuariivirgaceae bacterium]|jgi:L-ascorbate metabolism protein UlaG (beta-lactamase superfamily)